MNKLTAIEIYEMVRKIKAPEAELDHKRQKLDQLAKEIGDIEYEIEKLKSELTANGISYDGEPVQAKIGIDEPTQEVAEPAQEKSLLQEFLESKGAWDKFLANLENPDCAFFEVDLHFCINQGCNGILNAFNWNGSPEGLDFWSDLNIEFEKFYNERCQA